MESWSGVWSGVESTLNSCNLGRAFEMQLRNESTLKTLPLWPFILNRTNYVDIKDAKKTGHKTPYPWHIG